MDNTEMHAEPTADVLEKATSEADFSVREARRRQELQAAAEMPKPLKDAHGNATDECVSGCGEQVEPARLALGLGRCCACAHELEARSSHAKRTRAY